MKNKAIVGGSAVSCMLAATFAAAPVQAQEFSYNGDTGPGFWSELSEDWSACAGAGPDAAQSPIDIATVQVDDTLRRLDLHTVPTSIDVFNNGHTIEQHYAGTGSMITFEGRTFELQQFHFHTFSEHSVAGDHAVMEMHGVFSDAAGENLVVGVLFELSRNDNQFLQALIDAGLPQKDGDTTESSTMIDFGDGLTNTNKYYTYPGSLTTPPCSETVTWVVLAKSAKMTHEQYEAFRRILGNNFRPTQARNSRTVRATHNAVAPAEL